MNTTNTQASACCRSGTIEQKTDTNAQSCGCAPAAKRRVVYTPAVDVTETPEAFTVIADVPGAEPEGVDLTLDDGVLTLRAEVADRWQNVPGFVHREYGVGSYERTFRVGEGVDAAGISAELTEGVLSVRLPKAESAKPRKIEIKTK